MNWKHRHEAHVEISTARWLGLLPHRNPPELGERIPSEAEFAARRKAYIEEHGAATVKRRFKLTWPQLFPEFVTPPES